MRKIIVYIATSADGYIARRNGGVDWLDRRRTAGDYGMGAFYRTVDTVIMGRRIWSAGLRFGQTHYPGKRNYVFTRRHRSDRAGQVEFVNGRIPSFCGRLRGAKGRDIWLAGGAQLIGAFLDAGQVDQLIVHVVPTLIGEGIPLLQPKHRTVPLSLISARRFTDGVVRLHYAVRKSHQRPGPV